MGAYGHGIRVPRLPLLAKGRIMMVAVEILPDEIEPDEGKLLYDLKEAIRDAGLDCHIYVRGTSEVLYTEEEIGY